MKFGFYNIFTSAWFLIMLLSSGTLAYFSFFNNLYSSDALLILKIIIGLISVIFLFIFFFLLYKFRILLIINNQFISIHPFLFKYVKIHFSNIKRIKWENFSAFKGTIFRKVEIKSNNSKIEISDLEFENFDKLVQKINKELEKKEKIRIKQAKSNNSMMQFNVVLLFSLLIFLIINMIWNKLNTLIIIFFFVNLIFLYASTKRLFNYRKIIKHV